MMGCRYGAKNTLDLNYLYLAEKRGARVFPETRVVDVKPIGGASSGSVQSNSGSNDGSAGYEVDTVNSTAFIRRQPRRFTCRGVVFSASSLGTMELLFRLKEKGSLPAISDQLGRHVRTNSESLIGARTPGYSEDLSQGIAIGSGIYIDEHTHIEAVRYPKGSRRHGVSDYDPDQWPSRSAADCSLAEERYGLSAPPPFQDRARAATAGMGAGVCILLCMQALDGEIEMRWQRPWFWPFRKFLVSRGEKVPTYIPKANEFAQKYAQLTGGFPMSMLPEILVRCSGNSALHRRLRDRRFPQPRRRGFSPPRLPLQEHVHL